MTRGVLEAGMGPRGMRLRSRGQSRRGLHAEKASVLLPIPGSTMSWGRGVALSSINFWFPEELGDTSRGLPSNPAKERTLGEPCDLLRGLP